MVEVVSWGKSDEASLSAMNLGSALLERGNKMVQQVFLACVENGQNERFFSQLAERIKHAMRDQRRKQQQLVCGAGSMTHDVHATYSVDIRGALGCT